MAIEIVGEEITATGAEEEAGVLVEVPTEFRAVEQALWWELKTHPMQGLHSKKPAGSSIQPTQKETMLQKKKL